MWECFDPPRTSTSCDSHAKVMLPRWTVFAYSTLSFIQSPLIFVRLFRGCSRPYLFSYRPGRYTSFGEINHSNRSTSSAASDSVTELTRVYKYWWWTIYKTSVRFTSRDNCSGDKKRRKGVQGVLFEPPNTRNSLRRNWSNFKCIKVLRYQVTLNSMTFCLFISKGINIDYIDFLSAWTF